MGPATAIDARSGFCSATKTFYSLRLRVPLPSQTQNHSITSFVFSLLPSLPQRPAFLDATTGATLSYADLHSQVHSLAAALLSLPIALSKGDVAFILSPSCLEIPALYFALFSIGVVVCPSSPILTEKDVAHQVDLVNPTVAFATSATAHLLPRHLPTVLIDSPRFRSFLVGGGAEVSNVEIKQSDTAVILFSSGTTGMSKAAASTHRNHMEMIAGFHAIRGMGNTSTDVMLLVVPMFHSFGFFFTLKGVASGDTTVIMTGRTGFPDMLRSVETYNVTKMAAAPPVIVLMSRLEKESTTYDLSALQSIITGGAPVRDSVARRFTSRFPWVAIEQAYGSTEGGANARAINEEECRNYKSVGRLNQNTEAKIVDPITNESLPSGRHGELHLRSPCIMKGYVGNDEATSTCLDSDGWLKTGDLCYFDQEGCLYIVDRLKELIKYKAYQVPPVELEQLLLSLPGITDVAVVPHPHEEAGQVPMACVVRQPGSSLSESEVMGFVAKQVAPYKRIRKVAFVNSIPKSPSGKILRRVLASQVAMGSLSSL